MPSFPDARHAVRHLRQSPGYVAASVLTLALAIGANSAIFSAVNTVLLRPVPVASPGDLAVIWQTDAGGQAVIELTYRHLREWKASGATFTHASVMGSHNWSAVLTGRGEPARVWFSGVSADFFETLGVSPLLGRALTAEDDVPNAPAVAVLNHAAWIARFGGNPAVIGTTMSLNGNAVEIVGVMPAGMDVPRGAEFWVPVVPVLAGGTPVNATALDAVGVFYVLGRVRPGVSTAATRSEVDALEAELDRTTPGRLKWGSATVVTGFLDHLFGPVRPALRILWAAVLVLLLIACANISGLMLTRVAGRRHEHGIRLALGATGGRIARVWISEVLIVATAGGLLGLAAAHGIIRAIVTLAPDDVPRVGDIAIDPPVALFTLGAVVLTALLTGAVPLRHARMARVIEALDGERATASPHPLQARSMLLIVQVAFSVVLLVAAGLVVRSFAALSRVDLGFSPARVLTLTVQPQNFGGPANSWLHQFLERVRSTPGGEAAGAVYLRPLVLGPIGQGVRVYLEGQPETRETADANPTLNHQIATPGYFETMRIPLRSGRVFTDRDTTDTPRVAVVGESTARRLWPGQDPLGRRLSMSTFTPGGPPRAWRTVVGVVADVRYRGLQEVQLDVYDPALQVGRPADNILVRTSAEPLGAAGAIRDLARQMDATSIVDGVTTMEAVVRRAEAPWRLTMWMFVLFAGLAFGLAAIGLFSLVAIDVAQRRREFAVRLALGASRGAIVGGVIRRAAARVAIGVTLGAVVAAAASRTLRGLLFGVAPEDAVTYAFVLTAVVLVAGIAAYLPARRAAAIDPQALWRNG